MSVTFTKLFSSITESTVWCEPAHTRLVWITMLAMADRKGRVWASVPGLANRARVPQEDVEKALDTFMKPDRYSRTKDHDGRRIEEIDGGWILLNHSKYREIRDQEDVREKAAERKRKQRAKEAAASHGKSRNVTKVTPRHDNAEAEADPSKRQKLLSGKPDEFPGFTRFWNIWPVTERKGGKAKCLTIWKRKGLEAKAGDIIAHVEKLKASESWRTGFDPMPATYLNQDRWDGASIDASPLGQKPWYINGWSSFVERGKKHGLIETNFETPPEFREAVLKAEGITREQITKAEAEWRA